MDQLPSQAAVQESGAQRFDKHGTNQSCKCKCNAPNLVCPAGVAISNKEDCMQQNFAHGSAGQPACSEDGAAASGKVCHLAKAVSAQC